ncbi:MAG TPA: hypothetical protein VMT89_01985, partial [Candidatus Acidoferrales bacterium]|nr:hypothetical protein [Candidatus Acidoferrales bacterium]
ANTVSPAGNVDPVPSNNTATVELNFIDQHDAEQATEHESVIKSVTPLTISVPLLTTSKSTKAGVKVVNADYRPFVEIPGHTMEVNASDGTCPTGTVGVIDYDSSTPGNQNSVVVKGGASKGGKLPLSIDTTKFRSGNKKSPARCIATVSVAGPHGDVGPSNNTTRLVINVSDHNDF